MTRFFGAVLAVAALAFFASGLTPGSADANGRVRTGCGVVAGVHTPIIHHTPIHHHGGHHVDKIVVAVPFAVPSIAFQYLPAVQPPAPVAAGHAISPADIDRMIEERIKAREGHKIGATSGGIPIAKPRVSATPAPERPAGPGTTGGTSASDVVGILTNRCASCHTGSGSKGGFTIFSSAGVLAPLTRAQKSFISTAADTAFMPPSAGGDINHPNAVPSEEVNRLKSWVLE